MSSLRVLDRDADQVIKRIPKRNYARFVENVERTFKDYFMHNFPSVVSPKLKITKWLISEKRFQLLLNLLQQALEEEIEREDTMIQLEEQQKSVESFRAKMKEAKEDLDYITNNIIKITDKELYG